MAHLYDELKAAGCRLGNHESDLYVKVDDISRPLISEAAKQKRIRRQPTLFRSIHPEDAGALWYEIPFAFSPFWRARGLKG